MIIKNYKDDWAVDISKNTILRGEIKDIAVINQSIEMILTTGYGDRIFNPSFGCSLESLMFESLTEQTGERLLDTIIKEIEQWEDRITILSQNVSMDILRDENSIVLKIPYIIKRTSIKSQFEKKIIF